MNNKKLIRIRKKLGLSTNEMCEAMGVPYNTFKSWQNGSRNMSAGSVRCVELLIAIKGTEAGKRFGV